MFDRSDDSCVICGGDGRIGNAFGATKSCPGCGGTGRKMEDFGARDVTKTKSSQGRAPPGTQSSKEVDNTKSNEPRSSEGIKLAAEVQACGIISLETKSKMVREIVAYEASHGECTKTFAKKVRKQLRPPV